MVTIAAVGTCAGDVAELIDVDTLIELRDVRDHWRSSLHQTASISGGI